ncbi:MAG: hypothetical protein SXV54_07605 [Chloroflexota bacterium]|nr:hypothetical protein [Chloroflexota bacterium]
MVDGRQLIEDTRNIILEVSAGLDAQKGTFSDEQFAEFEMYIESAQKWVKLCRKKVWLRGKEGTDMAQRCLSAADRLQTSLDKPAVAIVAAADVSTQLESLARVISTKSQVLT